MSLAAVNDQRDDLPDPDLIKMPENPKHRRAVDVIGLAATHHLGEGYDLYRDMNWYPTDGGNAVAPDIMILPAGAIREKNTDDEPNSYRQDKTGGPTPLVALEVPSPSNDFAMVLGKLNRYVALGTTAFVALAHLPNGIYRAVAPKTGHSHGPELKSCLGQPIPELGNIVITFHDGQLAVTTPDGITATTDAGIIHQLNSQAATAQAKTDSARAETEAAQARAQALAEQLRKLGVEPDESGNGA